LERLSSVLLLEITNCQYIVPTQYTSDDVSSALYEAGKFIFLKNWILTIKFQRKAFYATQEQLLIPKQSHQGEVAELSLRYGKDDRGYYAPATGIAKVFCPLEGFVGEV